VSRNPLVAIVSPDAPPLKRIVQESREQGVLIDATYGRKTKSVLIADTGHVILSALTPEVIAGRLEGREPGKEEEDEYQN
ncbi:MAG: DUF370 domain-containing protein, partial [Clostridiales bacterium]|nr:DUF370 domain-containing protein [Clostridiales bacterium]